MPSDNIINATDWVAVQRKDGSCFIKCGSGTGPYHYASDFSDFPEDYPLAERICNAMNYYNITHRTFK